MFKRVNRITGEEIIGLWGDVCDLDVRLWTHAQKIEGRIAGRFATRKECNQHERIASVWMHIPSNQVVKTLWVDVMNHTELVGVYI